MGEGFITLQGHVGAVYWSSTPVAGPVIDRSTMRFAGRVVTGGSLSTIAQCSSYVEVNRLEILRL